MKTTPDRGHPVAQQVVLGAWATLASWFLVLTALPFSWFRPPGWVWLLAEAVLVSLGVIYARIWLWPRDREANGT